jgi:hypothetical protein
MQSSVWSSFTTIFSLGGLRSLSRNSRRPSLSYRQHLLDLVVASRQSDCCVFAARRGQYRPVAPLWQVHSQRCLRARVCLALPALPRCEGLHIVNIVHDNRLPSVCLVPQRVSDQPQHVRLWVGPPRQLQPVCDVSVRFLEPGLRAGVHLEDERLRAHIANVLGVLYGALRLVVVYKYIVTST